MKKIFWITKNIFLLNRRYKAEKTLINNYCLSKKMLGLSNPNDSSIFLKLLRLEVNGKDVMLKSLLIEADRHNINLAVHNRELVFPDNKKPVITFVRKDARDVPITWRDIAKVAKLFDLWGVEYMSQISSINCPNRAVKYTNIPPTEGTDIF